jgi:ribosomal protein S24E
MPIEQIPTTASVRARLAALAEVKKNSVCVAKNKQRTKKLRSKLNVVILSPLSQLLFFWGAVAVKIKSCKK